MSVKIKSQLQKIITNYDKTTATGRSKSAEKLRNAIVGLLSSWHPREDKEVDFAGVMDLLRQASDDCEQSLTGDTSVDEQLVIVEGFNEHRIVTDVRWDDQIGAFVLDTKQYTIGE